MRYFEHIVAARATFKIASESFCRSYPATCGRRASIQPLEQGCEHRRRYAHHAVCDRWPNELATFETLVHQHQARSIPDQNFDPVRPTPDILHTVFEARQSHIRGIPFLDERFKSHRSDAARI
ncbi:hypothetical protein HAP48_0027020 [Bradyrhizobium septentrionale]|nr:hypothetical protein [Bradyrhizobium septentrionale]UGY12332.1 hypothetical protein HAP48_0027020 [Bradyrhizobium septentrionale]UGY25556.1 hypothetical protein HU675_0001155 [Bradyrhizobium septentrionale]